LVIFVKMSTASAASLISLIQIKYSSGPVTQNNPSQNVPWHNVPSLKVPSPNSLEH
jgi:hypothetical protein